MKKRMGIILTVILVLLAILPSFSLANNNWNFSGVTITNKTKYVVGDTIEIKPNISGATNKLKYKFVWSHNDLDSFGVISPFSTTSVVNFKIPYAGKFVFYVDIQDGSKVVTKTSIAINVSPAGEWNFSSVGITNKSSYVVGDTIKITPNVSGTKTGLRYKYVWSNNNFSKWGIISPRSSSPEANFKFPHAGKFDILVDVTDGVKLVTRNSITINVLAAGAWDYSGVGITSKPKYMAGDTIEIKPNVSGATGNLKYKFVWSYNNFDKWGIISPISTKSVASFKLPHAGKFAIYVDVHDGNKVVTRNSAIMNVEAGAWNFSNVSVTNKSTYYTGDSITITPNVTGTKTALTYKYVWSHNNLNTWGVIKNFSTSTSTTMTLTKPGKYDLYVDVFDGVKVVTKIHTINVSSTWNNDGITASTAPHFQGNPITLTANASGSLYGANYKFVYSYGDNWSDWGVIKNSTSKTVTFIPKKVGKVSIYLDVLANGGVKTKKIDLNIIKKWSYDKITLNKSQPYKLNTPITVNALLSGDTNGLTYKFVYGRDNWSELVVVSNSTSKTATFTPKTPGVYDIYVDVIDSYDKSVQTKSLRIYVSDFGWVIGDYSFSNPRPTVGSSTTMKFSAAGYGNLSGVKYKFVAHNKTNNNWPLIRPLGSNTHTWTPTDPGEYDIYLEAVDTAGNWNQKIVPMVVEPLHNSSVKLELSTTNATIPQGKTLYIKKKSVSPSGSKIRFISNNSSVASVDAQGGYVYAAGVGSATISAIDSVGKTAGTCTVKVTGALPIRVAYTSPNNAAINSNVTMYAITDKTPTAAKFVVNGQTINATSKVADGNTYIWSATTKINKVGTFPVTAYSYKNGSWATHADGNTSIYVTGSTNTTATALGARRTSDKGIQFIAESEGFSSKVYGDLGGTPTIGYGRALLYGGELFYNGITQKEGFGQLVNMVNDSNYSKYVNNMLVDNNMKFNQHQFDALVSFSYHKGASWTLQMYDSKYKLRGIILRSANKDLNSINKQEFADRFNYYHHMTVGNACVPGLIYRRINELEIFFLNEYVRKMPPPKTSQNSWFYFTQSMCKQ